MLSTRVLKSWSVEDMLSWGTSSISDPIQCGLHCMSATLFVFYIANPPRLFHVSSLTRLQRFFISVFPNQILCIVCRSHLAPNFTPQTLGPISLSLSSLQLHPSALKSSLFISHLQTDIKYFVHTIIMFCPS